MASAITEEQLIDKLAEQMLTVDGITTAYGFAQNPQSITDPQLPAVVFYPYRSRHERKGHKNVWTNEIRIRGLLFVTQRMGQSGDLKIVENRALVFPQRLRAKYQTESVISDLLALGVQVADFEECQYGAGGMLQYMGTEFIGFTLEWVFRETR